MLPVSVWHVSSAQEKHIQGSCGMVIPIRQCDDCSIFGLNVRKKSIKITTQYNHHRRSHTGRREDLQGRTQPLVLASRHSIASRGGYGTRMYLSDRSVSWASEHHGPFSPAWSTTLKSYKKECPGAIGHWFTEAAPSAQLVCF